MKKNRANQNNETEISLERLIIALIYQGVTFDELMEPTKKIKNKKNREEMQNKITKIILNFINEECE